MNDADFDGHLKSRLSAYIRHVELLESVARLHGVQNAGAKLQVSHPAVLQTIVRIESLLGVTLLDARSGARELNACGVVFQRRALRLLAQLDASLVDIGVPSGDAAGRRAVGSWTGSRIGCLMAAVESGSVEEAARSLGVSQLRLQRIARDFEQDLGAPLYLQTEAGVVAMPAAIELARRLRIALRELDLCIEEIEAVRGNMVGDIVIGVAQFDGSTVLASVIDEYASACPAVNIRMLDGSTEDMLRNLRHGDVDCLIGMVREPAPPGLVNEALAESHYCVVARQGHPLTLQASATLDELAACEWVTGMPGVPPTPQFEHLFLGRQRPRARIATGSLPTLRLLLSQSDRLALLTPYELSREAGVLAAVPFGSIELPPTIGLTVREGWLPTQMQRRFLDLVHQRIANATSPERCRETGLSRHGSRHLKVRV